MNRSLLTVLLIAGLVLVGSAWAQDVEDELHQITGFRSAQFGMTADQVREAIRRDFQIESSAIQEIDNVDEATRILSITVPAMEPGPGAAEVYYILGATSQRLMHINVVWATSDSPRAAERDHIGIAGMQLARYFSERNWKPDGAVSGVSNAPGEVLLFAGVDPDDAGVTVLVSGIPITDAAGNVMTPEGQALLRVSYMQRFGQPDTVSVDAGQF